jgi:hypothetical protein
MATEPTWPTGTVPGAAQGYLSPWRWQALGRRSRGAGWTQRAAAGPRPAMPRLGVDSAPPRDGGGHGA